MSDLRHKIVRYILNKRDQSLSRAGTKNNFRGIFYVRRGEKVKLFSDE